MKKKTIVIICVLLLVFSTTVLAFMGEWYPIQNEYPIQHEDYTEIEFIPNNVTRFLTENNTELLLSIYVTPQPWTPIDTVSTDLIIFPADILQVTDIEFGDLFPEKTVQILGTIDNINGTITYMCWGSATTTFSPGYFANITFEIISGGRGEVIIDENESLVAYQAQLMPFKVTNNTTFDFTSLILSNEFPANRTENHPVNLQLEVDIESSLNNPMDLYFTSNVTNEWRLLDQILNCFNGRYSTSCYGVIHSPYNNQVEYVFKDWINETYLNNTCQGKHLGNISKVEIYQSSYVGDMTPIFLGLYDGDTYFSDNISVDITHDIQAPTVWEWSDIKNLQLRTPSNKSAHILVTYDLGYGEGERIDWSVNLTDGYTWVNESYWYVTEKASPVISNPTPRDAGTWDFYYPTLSVDIYDPQGEMMNISFYWLNETGAFIQIGTNQTGGNGTYYQPTSFDNYSELYPWVVVAENSQGFITEKRFRFFLRDLQDAPFMFETKKVCYEQINISWIKPEHVDYTRIQRRIDRYPLHPYDGLNIYNGTDSLFIDTAVNSGTLYFYSAWSWNNTDKTWSDFNHSTVITSPLGITNFTVETIDYQSINISWTKSENAETTIIRRKQGSYPDDPFDGILVYEGNGTSFIDTNLGSNITYFYRAWAHYWDTVNFTSGSGTWQVPQGVTNIDVLAVGGGGGSGRGAIGGSTNAGGGGAGGLIWMPFYPVTPGEYLSYSIGSGGSGAGSRWARGGNGENTLFGDLVALGGGGGGGSNGSHVNGRPGGSGGGGGRQGSTYFGIPGESLQSAQSDWSGFFGYGYDGSETSDGGGGGAGGPGVGIQGGPGVNMSATFGMSWGYNGIFSSGGGARNSGVDAIPNSGMGGRARSRYDGSSGRPGGSGIVLIRYSSLQVTDIGVLQVKTKISEGIYDYYSCEYDEDVATTEVGPPSVQTLQPSGVDDHVATLNGVLYADGGELTTVGFIWENKSGVQNITIGVRSKDESFSHSIDDLDIGTSYFVKAWAFNTHRYVEGREIIFNTKPEAPKNLTIFDVAYSSMNISWDVGLGADMTLIRFKNDSYPVDKSDGFLLEYSVENFSTASGLEPNVTYYFRIWSVNSSSGYSNLYDEANQTTLVGPPIVRTLAARNIENETATIRGSLIDDRGDICTIGFRWGPSSGEYTHNITKGTYTTGMTITHDISELSKGNTYYYQCWAANQVELVFGDEVSFSTRPVEPSAFFASRYGARQINLSWINEQGADSVLIIKKIDEVPSSMEDGEIIYMGANESHVDGNLSQDETWHYRIWSYNNTNQLYSTDNVSAYARTGFLPNITSMTPCLEINVARPPELTFEAEGSYSHLTYNIYGFYGDAPKILGKIASVDGPRWNSITEAINYSGSASYYWSKGKHPKDTNWHYSPWLTISFDKYFLEKASVDSLLTSYEITGIYLEHNNPRRIQVSFYNADTGDWLTQTSTRALPQQEHFPSPVKNLWNLDFPTNVSEIRIRIGNQGLWFNKYVTISGSISYAEFILKPDLIHSNTVLSGTTDQVTWTNAVEGSKYHSWLFEVYDGIDYLFNHGDIPLTDVDDIHTWCNFETEGVVIANPSPYDGEDYIIPIEISICSADINHTSGETMDITFSYFDGIEWVVGGQNLSVGNGTYQWELPGTIENNKTYYWSLSIWDGFYNHIETYIFTTRDIPLPPLFNVTNYNATVISISNISGDEKTDSILIRAKIGSYPENRTDGMFVVNTSASSFNHVGLYPDTAYYYKAWAWNETDGVFSNPSTKNISTPGPEPPSFNLSKFKNTVINITDITINDAYSDTVLIRAKIGSYPVNRTDGMFVVNTSASSFDHINLQNTTHYYYRAWAYDEDTNWWSLPTSKHQRTNGPPTVSDFYPYYITIDDINPRLEVMVGEYNSEDELTVYFRSNYSGLWETIDVQIGYAKTYYYESEEFFHQDYEYWWSVNVTDGHYWANSTFLNFTTGSMNVPSVTATTINTSKIVLTWERAQSTTHTWIQRKIDEYPVNRTDGDTVYFGTGEYVEDTGLQYAELYRYTIWSYNETSGMFSSGTRNAQALTKPHSPTNFTAMSADHRSISLNWDKGLGSHETVIIYNKDTYPQDRFDGIEIYFDNGTSYVITGLKPDDYYNYYSPFPGTDNFGVYGDGDPFEYSCDDNITTKWDLNRGKVGNFSYILGLVPQRIKGFAMLYQDFYEDPGTDWEAAITDFEVFNGTWHHDWSGKIVNTNTSAQWHYYESPVYYDNATEVRFSAWTEWITPNLYEVYVGKLGYVYCFRAWAVVTKGGITQYSDEYDSAENRTDDTPPNQIPEIHEMNPANGTEGMNLNPLFNVTISDADGDLMNISWQYLQNDSWIEFAFTSSVTNGTYSVHSTVFTEFEETYYWRVVVQDDTDTGDSAIQENTNISEVYWFSLREMFIPNDPTSFSVEAYEWHQMNLSWVHTSEAVYIERNSSETWDAGEGLFIYLGNDSYVEDTNVEGDTTYYYQIWGYNLTDNSYSLNYLSANDTTAPHPNDPPFSPSDGYVTTPLTADETYMDVYDVTMHCLVIDPNGDDMDVNFYWGNGTFIGTAFNVSNNSIASLSLPGNWSRQIMGYEVTWVEHDTTYYWYATASDLEFTSPPSETWSFHTNKAWDLNSDRIIDSLDISILVSHYGSTVIPPGKYPQDVNDDGIVDALDLSLIVNYYGISY